MHQHARALDPISRVLGAPGCSLPSIARDAPPATHHGPIKENP